MRRPAARAGHRPIGQQLRPPAAAPSQARPGPGFGLRHEAGPQRIALHIAQHGEQVLVLIDRKRLKTPLPHVAAAVVVPMVAADMGGEQPLHPAAQVAVAARPEHEVEMVGHQHVAQDSQRQPLVGLRHQFEEGGVVAIFVKHFGPRIAAIEHVVAHPTGGRPRCSGHAGQPTAPCRPCQLKVECPLFRFQGGPARPPLSDCQPGNADGLPTRRRAASVAWSRR